MNVEELYMILGADYNEVLSRLMSAQRVAKYLQKFSGTSDFSDLENAIKDGDWEKAFLSVHTLKGMALNLALTNIAQPASNLTEELRGGLKSESSALNYFSMLSEEYHKTIEAINSLDESVFE